MAPVETPSPKQRGCARTTDIFVGRARASGARPLLDHPERSIGDVARIAPPALVTKGTNSRLAVRRLVNVLGRAPGRRTARDADTRGLERQWYRIPDSQ